MIPVSPLAIGIATFVFGACIGSFLNVVIHRLPRGESLVHPGSHCPKCQSSVRWFDNIPLFSYALLRGRCRGCGQGIHWRYPLVELLTGLSATAVFARFGPTGIGLVYFAFVAVLIAISFIDIDYRIIPDRITLPGIPIAIVCSAVLTDMTAWGAIGGAAVGGGFLYMVSWLYFQIKRVHGLGMGDVKLMALIGGLLGWQGVLFTIFFGSAAGTMAGVAAMAVQGRLDAKMKIPFGPFLSFGAIAYLFVGQAFFHWYVSLLAVD